IEIGIAAGGCRVAICASRVGSPSATCTDVDGIIVPPCDRYAGIFCISAPAATSTSRCVNITARSPTAAPAPTFHRDRGNDITGSAPGEGAAKGVSLDIGTRLTYRKQEESDS